MMKFESTRGSAPVVGFEDALLAGLANDGGLYVPQEWPELSPSALRQLRGKSYGEIAFAVMWPYVEGAIGEAEFKRMIAEAYGTFAHRAVAPLVQLDDHQWLLELFHGPTLAFKDVAMQLLARMMDWALEKHNRRATIVGATSGDTGGAAIEAFKSSSRSSIFILHPKGRVSDVQRRQMTTVAAPHVFNLSVSGNFDDCQALVKAMFNDAPFRDQVALSGVNSINWARIMPQIVYYVSAALSLGAPDRPVSFSVPTGNFGDIFAGMIAKRMGVPIDQLVIATNVNDILYRTITTGRYEVLEVVPSSSPSMDIQVSSNFERALFGAYGRDAGAVTGLMDGLSQSGSFTIAQAALAALRADFSAVRADEETIARTMRDLLEQTGEVLDPHTAAGVHAAWQSARDGIPMVTLATAHPAKFPTAVKAATDVEPELPGRVGNLFDLPEHMTELANGLDEIEEFILKSQKIDGAPL